MHEMSLMRDLLRKIDTLAAEQNAQRVTAVGVRIGALAHISAEHFREHFIDGTRGSIADNARLDIDMNDDTADPLAQSIVLTHIEVEDVVD
jgi:hydrogenase nickel incorporation protein HypA/HybF